MWVCPFVPDTVLAFLQPAFVCDSFDKKFELARDESVGDFLCCEQRETIAHVVFKHDPRNRPCPSAGSVSFVDAIIQDVAENVVVGVHRLF